MKPEVPREQHMPLPICALQIALGLTWDRRLRAQSLHS